ncbi:MAG: alpha/beta hydrolase [Alphaproteobacteria bacterium]|nr:alpha/beta hydrolase [Alphaproteobacteria bacterium]
MPHVVVGGGAVYYQDLGPDRGEGEPVILAHSSTMSGAQWRSLAEILVSRHRLLIPDLWGYGDSDPWPGPGPLTLAGEAAIIFEMMRLAGAPAHLVGHSYGGAACLHAALAEPDRVASLVAYEPVAFHFLDRSDAGDAAAHDEITCVADRISGYVMAGDMEGSMEFFVDYWNGPGAWRRLSDETRVELAGRAPKVVHEFAAILDDDVDLADPAQFDRPVLLLSGERSPSPAGHVTARLAKTLTAARLETVADASHMGPVTHRDPVNRLIVDYLSALAKGQK